MLLAALVTCCFCGALQAAEGESRVLILYGVDPYLPPFLSMDRAMRDSVATDVNGRVHFFSETLDSQRIELERLEPELVGLLAKKYEALPINVVVAVSRTALQFVERHGERLWPGARVVYVGFLGYEFKPSALPPHASAVVSILDVAGTIAIARRLQPDARRMLVVAGGSEVDRTAEQQARDSLAVLGDRLSVDYLSGLPLHELQARVAAEPADSIVVYLVQFRDRDGKPNEPFAVLRGILAASRAPVYGAAETYIGMGAVAGSVASYERRGQLIGEQVMRALAGPPDPSRTVLSAPNRCVADARALLRWRLDEARLPEGCEQLFVDRPLWRQYQRQIVAVLAIIAAQAALIGALVVQRRWRRLAESESATRYAELVHMNRRVALGEMSASIAHELNQPLGAIRNNASAAEILIKANPPRLREVADILADIKRDDQRASDVIERIRSLLRKTNFQLRDIDLNAAIDEALRVVAGEAIDKQAIVETELESGLPPVSADRVQLQQVILNLALNAIEAMQGQSAQTRVLTISSRRANEREAEICVADSGPGIPRDMLGSVFDPFVSSKPGGMGLGLAISRTIVESHRGALRADNSPQGGARVSFTLPFARGVQA